MKELIPPLSLCRPCWRRDDPCIISILYSDQQLPLYVWGLWSSALEQLVGLYGFMLLCIWYGGSHTDQGYMQQYHGNNYARRSPSATFPATTKLSPNSDSCFHGLSNHTFNSGVNDDLAPQEDVFSELLRQESGAGVFWNFEVCISHLRQMHFSYPTYLGTAVSRADGYRLIKVSSSRPGNQIGLQVSSRHPYIPSTQCPRECDG